MAKEEKTIIQSFVPLLIVVIIAVVAFYVGRDSMRDSFNPRGSNTIYYKDTGYAVRIYIDSVFKDDR